MGGHINNKIYRESIIISDVKLEDNTTAGKYLKLDSNSSAALTADRTLIFDVRNADRKIDLAGDFRTLNNNVAISAVGAARTLTMNESLTVGDGYDGTLTYSATGKTLTVEDTSVVNQDLTSDASPTFAQASLTSLKLEGGTYDTIITPGTPTASVSYQWPLADAGSSGDALVSNASGTLSWATISADDEKVGIDSVATAGYLGAANNDGVLRAGSRLTYTDGGDFVTLDVSATPSFTTVGTTGAISINSGLATGETGLNLYSITPTFATICQSDAEGIASSSDTRIGLDETLRTLIICDRGDIGTDFGFSAEVKPMLKILAPAGDDPLEVSYNAIKSEVNLSIESDDNFSTVGDGIIELVQNVDVIQGNIVVIKGGSGDELTDANNLQSMLYIEPQVRQTGTAAFDGIHLDATIATLGDGTTGDGNNLLRLASSGVTKFAVSTDGDFSGARLARSYTVTTDTTDGVDTYTAAEMFGGMIIRSGMTVGAKTDVIATAAEIVAIIPGAVIGSSFEFYVSNRDNDQGIIVDGGVGVTTSPGDTTIPFGETAKFLAVCTNVTASSEAVTLHCVSVGPHA